MTDHDLAGAYAADALDDTERAAFDTHLSGCSSCRDEVTAAREVLGALAAAHPVLPPEALEDAIVATAVSSTTTGRGVRADDASAIGVAAHESDGRDRSARATPTEAPDPGSLQVGGPDASASARPLQIRRPVGAWLVAAAAAVAVFAGGVLVGRQYAPTQQIASPAMDTLLAVAAAEDATYMPVDLMGSEARVVVSDEMGKVAVLASDLAMPAKGQCYQVWKVAADGTKTSAGVFTPDEDGHVAVVLEGGPDVAGFVVTVEPPGGSKEPTGEMVGQVDA